MELTHRTHNLRVAPRKLRLVAEKVKHMNATQALHVLPLVNRGAAHHLRKSLQAAVQTAKDQNYNLDSLIIQRIFCDEGPSMKRMVMHSRGRASTIKKHFSHLSIVLKGEHAPKKRGSTEKKVESTAEVTPKTEEQKVEEK